MLRAPTARELFFQNLLARSAVLLHAATTALSKTGAAPTVVIECETFFSETASLIAAELEADAAALPMSAMPAEEPGEEWKGWPACPTLSPSPSTAENAPEPITSEEVSSSPSFGGITPTEKTLKPSLADLVKRSYAARR